ncbi:MAG: tyrosine-type recombinase/integrase [Candidatus Paracaedimonas acanthamoebae]|jgi:integrase|uniref:Tyrosine-type recombinase/integrase n=1 Tax=Candidatus Paracaedimonas acanthamoebae TaxID=244581 RepID=A0A8J7TTP6_9PROT|nr:tyrosine-type recombinase/integrase [Candidatus Paracaedimonas acanthamoebae]
MTSQSINKIKLTKRAVETAAPHPTKRLFLWDTEVTGFNLRIYPTGRKTYFLQYRNEFHKTHKIKIGVHGNLTTEEAREKARQLSLRISLGEDPATNNKENKRKCTMADLAKEYLELHAKISKRSKSVKDDMRMISSVILPKFGKQDIGAITSHELQKLHRDLRETPYHANRVRSLLSKMFNLAKEWGWRADNPVLNIEKYQEEKRDRWLNDEELQRLWAVLDKYNYHLTTYVFKLLLLTGARKGELLQATWDQFDLEKGIWTKPSHLTKQKKKEHLPLSENAIDVINELIHFRKEYSPYLFPSKIEGQPLQEIKTFWKKVIKEANLENVRIHDLRHTHASHLVSDGLSLSIVGKLLGHTQAATTQRYAHIANEPLRKATSLFGDKLKKLTSKEIFNS